MVKSTLKHSGQTYSTNLLSFVQKNVMGSTPLLQNIQIEVDLAPGH
jgi:hypothetical protein